MPSDTLGAGASVPVPRRPAASPARAPSAYRMEQAMSALTAARARLLAEDPTIADDDVLMHDMLDGEANDALPVLHRMLRAAVEADRLAKDAEAWVKDVKAREARYKRRSEAFRAMAFAAMDALELRRIEAGDLTASIVQPRPGVRVTDETALPAEFLRTRTEPDKTAIKAAIEAGQIVPGAETSNGLPTIQIRTR
jgi:hypothetical protein